MRKTMQLIGTVLILLSLLLSGCTPGSGGEEAEMETVVLLPELNYDLDDYTGEKVWSLGYYRNEYFTGDGVAFLMLNPYMGIANEVLTEHSFARLDGELPPAGLDGAEILVYGEVSEFGAAYDAFTGQPTPLITVERYQVIDETVPDAGWANPFELSFLKEWLFGDDYALAAEANSGTQASSCDRALIISGGVNANNNYGRYGDDVKAKYKKLKELGFSDDQIGVIYNDGGALEVDGSNITDAGATKENIQETIAGYLEEMSASCTLTIFVTDHGTGYRPDQGYHGARPAAAGDGETGETYAEGQFKVDLQHKVYQTSRTYTTNGKSFFVAKDKTGKIFIYMRQGGSWAYKGTDSDGDGWVTEDEIGQDLNGDGDGADDFGWRVSDLERCLTAAERHNDNTWDTDRDGTDDLRARWDGTRYVFERLVDGNWREMGRDTDGDFIIDGDDGGVDWNLDGDKNDQVGFHEGINLWGSNVLWDDDLANMLKPLQEKGIHIVVEMMQCFGGGFVNNLQGIVEKIVTAASEDNKSYARKNDAGRYENTFELAFADALEGIDLESWNRAFDAAKAEDTRRWQAEGSTATTENEYQVWEKPLIETESTFWELDGFYELTLTLPESLAGEVHDLEIFYGLQQPRWEGGEFVEVPEGIVVTEIDGGIRVESAEPFPITPLVFTIRDGAVKAQSLRIHLTDAGHRNLGYVSPEQVPPQIVLIEIEDAATTLGEALGTRDAEAGLPEDTCPEDAEDLIDYLEDFLADDPPADQVEPAEKLLGFMMDEVLIDYRQQIADLFKGSYRAAYDYIISQVELNIPIAMGAESVADESGCRSTITISYSAELSGSEGMTITSVVLMVNGEVWADSGDISTRDYHNAVSSEAGCGETFDAEVIVTTSNGATSTSTASLTTPVPE